MSSETKANDGLGAAPCSACERARNSTLEEVALEISRMACGAYFPPESKRKYKPRRRDTERGDLLIAAANLILEMRTAGIGVIPKPNVEAIHGEKGLTK